MTADDLNNLDRSEYEALTLAHYNSGASLLSVSESPFTVDHIFLEVVSHFPKNPRVLDLGCGFGRLVPVLRQVGITNIVGVDVSSGMLDEGRRLYPEVDFRCGDMARDLPTLLGGLKFDGFFAIATIMHLLPEKVPQVAKDLRAVLNKGAVGFISTPHGQTCGVAQDTVGDQVKDFDKTLFYRAEWELKPLFSCFSAAGFEPIVPSFTEGHMTYLTVRAI